MIDFTQLLDSRVDKAERPKPLPVGTYLLRITALPQQVSSRDKGTPGMTYIYKVIEAGGDVDQDQLAEIDLTKKQIKDTFWITEDAMFRFREFLEKLGLNVEERSFTECLPETPNREIKAYITQTASSKAGDDTRYNNIEKYLSVEE